MAHRVSAAALTAARSVLASYRLTVKPPQDLPSGYIPKLEATDRHLAVIIDYGSNIFEIANLRPELHHWQMRLTNAAASNDLASQVRSYLQRVLDAFAKLPKETEPVEVQYNMPHIFGGKQLTLLLSRPAREASRFVYYYYHVTPVKLPLVGEEFHRIEMAKIIDSALGLTRAYPVVPLVEHWHEQLEKGTATKQQIQNCLRSVGILMEYLPNYEDRQEEGKLLV